MIDKDKTTLKNGFTLIEAMVALLILTLAIIPTLAVTSSALDIAAVIQDDMIGAMLAQEGVEIVRSLRDYNWFACDEFSTGLVGGPYIVDTDTNWDDCNPGRSLTLASGNSSVLQIMTNILYGTKRYAHQPAALETAELSKFRRTVTINQVSAAELRVISEVSWFTKNKTTYPGCPADTRCARVESHLYNWK